MPSIAKKFFTASLIYLMLGLLSQVVAVFDVWLGFNPLAYTAMAATEQTFLLGWLTQLGLGLVYGRWLSPPERPISSATKIRAPKPQTPTSKPTTEQALQTQQVVDPTSVSPIPPPPSPIPYPPSPIPHPPSPLVVFVLFNLGLPLVIIGQPGLALFGGRWVGAAAAFGGLLQLFAGLLFVRDAWKLLRSKQ